MTWHRTHHRLDITMMWTSVVASTAPHLKRALFLQHSAHPAMFVVLHFHTERWQHHLAAFFDLLPLATWTLVRWSATVTHQRSSWLKWKKIVGKILSHSPKVSHFLSTVLLEQLGKKAKHFLDMKTKNQGVIYSTQWCCFCIKQTNISHKLFLKSLMADYYTQSSGRQKWHYFVANITIWLKWNFEKMVLPFVTSCAHNIYEINIFPIISITFEDSRRCFSCFLSEEISREKKV